MKHPPSRWLLVLGLGILAAVMVFAAVAPKEEPKWPLNVPTSTEEVAISEAHALILEKKEGREASILDSYIYIRTPLTSGAKIGVTMAPSDADEAEIAYETVKSRLPYPAHEMIRAMVEEAAVPITIERNPGYEVSLFDRLIQFLPILIIVAIAVFFLRRNAARGLGLNSAYKIIDLEDLHEGLENVAGIDTARGDIQEVIDFLRDPKEASRLGGRMPKGALFSGPPGNGKTLLARAMAKEAGVPFMTIQASGVTQYFVGAGAAKIKDAFEKAKEIAPCIVFIDEIDAMGRMRGNSASGASDEKETTLNALLVELDGFDSRDGIFVVAATNRRDILDDALTRRGRFDREIRVDYADIEGRLAILQSHLPKIKAEPGLDLRSIARSTPGSSGADLAALVNEASLRATRAGKDAVGLEDFQAARDDMLMPKSSSQRKLNEQTRKTVAVHEAGHAFIAALLPDADPIEKVTILPQGGALGYVLQMPEDDQLLQSRDQLIARIKVAVAGRVAEEVVFGPGSVTSGAASDIEAATRIARAMVTRYGMGNQGFILIDPQDPILYDMNGSALREIKEIISGEIYAVRNLLNSHKDVLLRISDTLLDEETISGEKVGIIVAEAEISLVKAA